MKRLFFSLYLLFACCGSLFAQKKLTTSRTSGQYTYIYKLTETEAQNLAWEPHQYLQEKVLHTQVDSFRMDGNGYSGKLPYGHYIYVSVSGNRLNYRIKDVQNVHLKFISDGNMFQFIVTDLMGRLLENAEVRQGSGKIISFDPASRSYHGKVAAKQKLIMVRYDGVVNYFKYAYQKPVKNRRNKQQSRPPQKPEKYMGQLHFNKPKYRPLDTVKFKTYLLTRKGKALKNKALRLELHDSGRSLYITTLSPYHEGGYEGSFVLSDTMKLKLDNSYALHFKEYSKGKWETVYSGYFQYEDYELKSSSFYARSDKTLYHPGTPVTFYMKAADENGLTIPDGRVEVKVKSDNVSKFYRSREFVKANLWKTELRLDPVGETKLLLPDSIFPKADMNVSVNFKFLNSNNESKEATRYFRYEYESKKLVAFLEEDSVRFDFRINDVSVPQQAVLYAVTANTKHNDSLAIRLPARIKINPQVTDYVARITDGTMYPSNYYSLYPKFALSGTQHGDSLSIKINNTQRVPFWYTIFTGNKVLKRGYANNLDTLFQNKTEKAAEIQLSYLWLGKICKIQKHVFEESQTLDIKLNAPAVVYPGQTIGMEVKVMDKAHQPVAGADLSAYAYSAKFGDQPVFQDFFEKPYVPRTLKQLPHDPVPVEKTGSLKLDWSRWHEKFGLDTVPYFQFIYPDELYLGREKIAEDQTVAVPFAITEGAIEPATLVYIDDLPVYYSGAKQLKRYAFPVSPGIHKVELFTAWSKVTFNHYFEKGFKTVLGIDSDPTNSKAQVSNLGEDELNQRLRDLKKYMVFINENFEGNKATIYTGSQELLLNPPPNTIHRGILYVGPILEKQLRFRSGDLDIPFTRDTNKIYTFLRDSVLERKIDSADYYEPLMDIGTEARNYKHDPLAEHEIDSIWTDYMDMRSRNNFFKAENSKPLTANTGTLRIDVDTALTNRQPYLKNVVIYRKDHLSFRQVYGGYSYFQSLDEGLYRILWLFKDNSYIEEDNVSVRSGGINYLFLQDKPIHPADNMSRELDHNIKFSGLSEPGIRNYNYKLPVRVIKPSVFQKSKGNRIISGTVVDESTGETLPGAGIFFGRPPKGLGQTNGNGYFSFVVPKKGVLTITYTGYENKVITIGKHNNLLISMRERANSMDEVVIRGYTGRRGRVNDVPVSNVEQLLQGKVAGLNIENNTGAPGLRGSVNIRGLSTISTTGLGSDLNQNALLIVDGWPFSGTLEQIDQTAIISIEVMKDDRATAIYGELGANGVIVIKTNGSQYFGPDGGEEQGAQQQSLRSNFSDYAFWQPKLLTDQNGKASFKVKFPDDITNWSTTVYAMNGHRQYGYLNTFTRSFKTLSANITAPLFALAGDSIKLIGKLTNYSDKDETLTRKFEYQGREMLNSSLTFKNAHIDTIGIHAEPSANAPDSLQFLYTLQQDKGYFDGEKRSIPLLQLGIAETKGYFNALIRDTALTYDFDTALGQVTLHAEASVFSVLLNEMDKLRNYEYLCNEQLASKLKGLILEQKLRKFLKQDFKGEKHIKELIKKLQDNRGPRGGWGWWQNTDDEMWISGHVVEALQMAKDAGYTTTLDTRVLYNYLNDQLNGRKNLDQLFMIRLMRSLENKYDFGSWIRAVEKEKAAQKDQTLFTSLQLMQLKQQAGMPVDISWLLKQKKGTMFGSSYWGEPGITFWDNSIQNTLLAYHILKTKGGYADELDKIIRYFLEQRKDGQWRNTYESSLILETILPELMKDGKQQEAPLITINKTEVIKAFPYTKTISPSQLTIDKKGMAPVYFTAYQRFHNPNPEKVSKDFSVKTSFEQHGKPVSILKGGVSAMLKAEVEVRADADYVMIEIPIPAGCSYENKSQRYWGLETHREYFKHKTSIFCTKLKQGKYTFNIQLMPRYSGVYNLNPAKAEMMYFPVFYGREGMKKVSVN